ncbi:PilZ domain-containing protein [Burkholderia cenocepacia]|uniref:PilZ domain-containing protein n=1 Tax=Burkholderia cenocepacia TaxID=95486 RepID=UPI0007619A89|nr:PilZ domain-containing protein [Burkholderia cenocepacia]KWU19147.1 hypothetical protein AS149_12935 [Burkholderia cenocepacia]
MALVKVAFHEVTAGTPLDYAVYSASGKLLAAKGYVFQSEASVERLFAAGAFKEGAASRTPSRKPAASPTAVSAEPKGAASHQALEAVVTDFPCAPTGPEVFQLSLKGADDRVFRADYVGAIKGKTLLVSAPADAPQFQAGSVLIAKVFFGRHIYLFETRVLARHNMPSDIVHLEYPQKTRRHILRKHLRVDVQLRGQLFLHDSVTTGRDATVVNASLSGLGVHCAESLLAVGDHFQLAVKLPFDDRIHPVMLHAVVRNVRNAPAIGQAIGAEIWQPSDDLRNHLQSFIFEAALGPSI